jgi:hypothetical protein
MLVPLSSVYPLLSEVERMHAPGAAMSTSGPKC